MDTIKKAKIIFVHNFIELIISKALELEKEHKSRISLVHPKYQQSAQNLLHYLAFRSFDTNQLQKDLRGLGLSSLTSIGAHVMSSLLNIQYILDKLLDIKNPMNPKGFLSPKQSQKLLRRNTKLLFGYKSKNRETRIMVTMPEMAAENSAFVKKLIESGMNCARINCAHNDQHQWNELILNIKRSSHQQGRNCKIAMDLGGPKLRTGKMEPGPKIIHIKPQRDNHGRVIVPARFWIAPADVPPPAHSQCDAILPVSERFFELIKRGDTLNFLDSRSKKGKIKIIRKEEGGKWGISDSSLYLETGTQIQLNEQYSEAAQKSQVGELLPKEQFITLFKGDHFILHKDPKPGKPAVRDKAGNILEVAHISCTLPEVFEDVKAGEPIFFNDGKIEGVIKSVSEEALEILILQAKSKGSKLRSDKGINLPESKLKISGLTKKDLNDLDFVAKQADVINFSFVNSSQDVLQILQILETKDSKAGMILKIETQQAFSNLPDILLTAMKRYPMGIMIARGDLAIETGWKNFASIQQEIMHICEAAHIPAVWATQVLESLAKNGTPSRAEITDAAMSQQSECVMLNKGPYIFKAIRMMDMILKRMEKFQEKTSIVLPKLEKAHRLELSHKRFDV
jgi:pyruvate kinase